LLAEPRPPLRRSSLSFTPSLAPPHVEPRSPPTPSFATDSTRKCACANIPISAWRPVDWPGLRGDDKKSFRTAKWSGTRAVCCKVQLLEETWSVTCFLRAFRRSHNAHTFRSKPKHSTSIFICLIVCASLCLKIQCIRASILKVLRIVAKRSAFAKHVKCSPCLKKCDAAFQFRRMPFQGYRKTCWRVRAYNLR